MPEIIPLQPEQVAEVKRMIYTVAHELFHDEETVEATIARYSHSWPLQDIDDFQHRYCDNGGVFLVMVDGDGESRRIIGSGAFKRLEENVCEIKRLWFLPEYHGQGLGYRMMQALLALARENGYTVARLETSPTAQQRAYAFYHRLGFYDIPRYGDDTDDIGMELKL